MTLIAILICLVLQRFANIGGEFKSRWFEFYLKALNPWITKLNEWLALLFILAPVLLFLAILNIFFAWRSFGLFNLILAIIVLFFCVDTRDLKKQLTGYFNELEKGDTQAAAAAVAAIVGDISFDFAEELNRTVTKAVLINSFERIFSRLFWFMIAGMYGVAIYFLIALLSKNSSHYSNIAKLAAKIRGVLDWIPSRLFGISSALVGSFNQGFDCCKKYLWLGLSDVRRFVIEAGIAALGIDLSSAETTPRENYAALDLIDRVLIVWVIALSFVLLGSLL